MEKVEKKEKGQANPKVALSSMTLNSYYKHEVFD